MSVSIKTGDGATFNVDREVAMMSLTIKSLLEDCEGDDNQAIPLQNVTGPIFEKVLEYCRAHKDDVAVSEDDDTKDKRCDEIEPRDVEFCKVDQGTLFEMILAANYLDIRSMVDLTCKTVANMMKGKKPEEIRKTFNIKNDFTPEEEEQVRKENEWCEER